MQIMIDTPPIYDRAAAVFPLTGNEIFAWDDIIYNPSGKDIPVWLVDHENVHKRQQAGEPEEWWDRYLVDEEFRYQMELEAHRVEYLSFCHHNKDRNKQSRYLAMISRRLAAPMYGNMITASEARKAIKS